MLVADLITFAAGFAQYDALHSVAIRRWRAFGVENDGLSIACEAVSIQLRSLELSEAIKNVVGGVSMFGYNSTCCFSVPRPLG